ncbi:DUF4326 domain-containing protein [Micromonospora sp. WMMA1998]|uniref:DUF4326 domain-containing protein n=1 Tax=Micromonospora sp. WMMA1998 TaxID=3015167 RepID=UPI00248D3922|nr:DUF4326 domain-containing protein [Micromonospora sp. WMMA1998]WBC18202.1 DUF4326 domain-containing protein [Micromonospora sp. WMMA1998]
MQAGAIIAITLAAWGDSLGFVCRGISITRWCRRGAVYVGRQGFGLRRSPWANPFSLRKHDRAEALRLYRQWLVGQPALVDRARRELPGKQLACWCRVEDACHADVLADIIG